MKKLITLIAAIVLTTTAAWAQCSSRNTAFQSGETLMYDLYFNWKFVWVKAGTAYMNTTQTIYQGKPALKTYLITRGSKQADKYFVMRDTLTSYCDLDLVPRYYIKAALEGKTYRKDQVWYKYDDGQCHVDMRHQKNNDKPIYKKHSSKYCIYDMISMLLRARSFDATDYKVGHRIKFMMADGHNCDWQYIVYKGKKKFKMEKSNTAYRCLVFAFVENEKGKEKEVVRFYVTDDKNHIPVRLDLNLNFGTAKAFLVGARGLRNPQTAKLK